MYNIFRKAYKLSAFRKLHMEVNKLNSIRLFLLVNINLKSHNIKFQIYSTLLLTLSKSNAACPEFSISMFLKEAEMPKQLVYYFQK